MFGNLLLLFGIFILIFTYGKVLFYYFRYGNVFIQKLDGFEIAKRATQDYDDINIVEAKNILISYYDSKRSVIRLTSRVYFGHDVFCLGIAYVLACYSQFYQRKNFFKPNFFRVSWCSLTMVFGFLLSFFTYTVFDARIGCVVLFLLLIIQYFHFVIDGFENTSRDICFDKEDMDKIRMVKQEILFLSKMSFVGNLVFLMREIVIMLNL